MAGYVRPPVVTDIDQVIQNALDRLTTLAPGWVPQEGHLEVWLIEVLGRMVAEGRDVASIVFDDIFKYYGQSLLGVETISSAPATASTTWTMVDDQGYTIPENTIVAFRTAGDTLIPFRTIAEIVVPPGDVSTTIGEVIIEAVEPGVAGNDLGPAGVELVDALAFVDTIVATLATSGGVDEEDTETYLDRLADELRLLSPRPILPDDFATLARRVVGVHRALAIDGYDPGPPPTNDNERMVTVAVVDESGAAVSLAVRNAVAAYLEDQREVNFVVHVIDPTYTVIDVDFTITVRDLYVAADVIAAAEATVADYLDPGNWGGGGESPPEWRSDGIVRYLEVAQVINAVDGVDFITALTVNGGGVDVALAGPAPLPQPGAITGASV